MNIFYLHESPDIAASFHYNKHVVKMILEAAQLLCTAHHVIGEEQGYDTSYVPYKKTHVNHPSAIWTRGSYYQYQWVYEYMMALGRIYERRYKRTHLTIEKCRVLLYTHPQGIKMSGFTPPPQCMPEEYRRPSAVAGYWNYYINAKKHIVQENEQAYLYPPLNTWTHEEVFKQLAN